MPTTMNPLPAHAYLLRNKVASSSWGRRIINAERKGRFSSKTRFAANRWNTCVCGKQDPRIPRYGEGGAPTDGALRAAGMKFARQVERDEFFNAAQSLVAIERRACQVLAQEAQHRAFF